MVDFVVKLIKDISSKEEQINVLVLEYNRLKDELFDLENFIPEEGSDFDKEMDIIDAKIHSVKIKLKHFKDAIIEFDALDLIEKKVEAPKTHFTIHNEKIKKRIDSDDEEQEDLIEEDDDENNHNRGIAHLIYDGLALVGNQVCRRLGCNGIMDVRILYRESCSRYRT